MFTSLVQLPTSVKETLISLENRNRLIEDFVIASVEEEQKPCGENYFRLQLIVGNRNYFPPLRQPIEIQLINAGVCFPDFKPSQEMAWKELKAILQQFYNPITVGQAIFQDCRNATVRGWIDGIQDKLPLSTYLKCKKLISTLGKDNYELSFEWYFGCQTPDDYWRGLE